MNWGKSIVVFFIVFVSAMLTFVVFSLTQRHDLVTDDYYEQGAAYTKQMVVDARSKPYADSVSIKVQGQHVKLELTSVMVEYGKNFEVCFYRPSNKQFDVTRSFKPDSTTVFLQDVNLKLGRYIAKFKWTVSDSVYMLNKDVFVE